MIQRTALSLFLVGCPLLLNSCALANLAKAPFTLLNGLLGAGGRSLGMGADNGTRKPLRLETGEVERAREATPATLPVPVVKEEHVATR